METKPTTSTPDKTETAAKGSGLINKVTEKVTEHPIIAGGVAVAVAGAAYAAVKAFSKPDETPEIASDVHRETSITIQKAPAELYAFWRNLSNLPLFMNNLESVTELDSTRSHWIAKGPAGKRIEWDAEIYNEKENELIAWRSLENADIANAGSVRFAASPDGLGTVLRVTVNYNPPAGKIGGTVAQLLGSDPAQLIDEDLQRLKEIIEGGTSASASNAS